jgi:hypothetical protein
MNIVNPQLLMSFTLQRKKVVGLRSPAELKVIGFVD